MTERHAESVASEPTLTDLVRELRKTIGLFDGAMACSPKEAWEEAIEEAERLFSYWLHATAQQQISDQAGRIYSRCGARFWDRRDAETHDRFCTQIDGLEVPE